MLKHHIDGLNLLTVHGREIESDGKLVKSACNYVCLFVVFYEISMIGFFSINSLGIQAFMVFLLMMATVFFGISNSGPFFDLSSMDSEYYASAVDFSEKSSYLWRRVYEHPLAVSHI